MSELSAMGGGQGVTRDMVRRLRRGLADNPRGALDALEKLMRGLPRSAAATKELNDLLLFCEAYPPSADAHARAMAGLLQFKDALEGLPREGRLRSALRDSGLHGCDTVGLYSYTFVRWLLRQWPGAVELHSIDAAMEDAAELLRPLLTQPEREALDLHAGDAAALVAALFGSDPCRQLNELVEVFESQPATDPLRETLFARLLVYVRIRGGGPVPSLTELRGPAQQPFFHSAGVQRSVDMLLEVDQPVGPPLRLSAAQRTTLIHDARAILCLMQRETDPVTYAQEVQAFDMGRGLVISLFHMDPDHRLALESYVGFMAFKNGVPLGYGGAWIFPGRSKVGINVFPSLRGGESAWFFAQLLRLYRQRFGVGVFEAENYQLGHGNPDGLKSGAYWFYYRLGFRPWNGPLGRIAAREFERMRKRKDYQPPMRVLKELVADGLVLRIADEGSPLIDTVALVMAAQRSAVKDATVSRQEALEQAEACAFSALALSRRESADPGIAAALRAWLIPLRLAGDYHRWPEAERRRVGRALRARAASTEDAYQAALRDCRMLLKAWAAACAPE